MKNLLLAPAALAAAALLALSSLGCPGGGGSSPDAGDGDDIDPDDTEVTVSGTAQVHPDAVKFFQAAGQPVPGISGLTLRVEEPLKVALNDPLGLFGSLVLTDAGTFSVSKVPTRLVNLGVAAGLRDDSDAGACGVDAGIADGGCGPAPRRVIRSATSLYDVALEGRKPEKDIGGGKAYAVPSAFHDKLTAAVTEARILQITGTNNKRTLLEAGFILGRIVNESGNPVSNATINPTPVSLASQFLYPTADLSGTQASTSSNGLFLFIHQGGDVLTFKYGVTGKPEYLQRNGGAAKEACLVVTVYPGKVAP